MVKLNKIYELDLTQKSRMKVTFDKLNNQGEK